MSIVADSHGFVVGVDTHARNNVFTILTSPTAAVIDTASYPNTIAGAQRALAWIARRCGGDASTLVVIEGVASYGALLAATITRGGLLVVEAPRMNARAHHAQGKSDALDSHRIAAAVLSLGPGQLRYPRLDDGARATVRVLLGARESMNKERIRHNNALTALVRTATGLGVDARKPLTEAQVRTMAAWRTRKGEDLATATARTEAIRLAKRILVLHAELKDNDTRLAEALAASEVAELTDVLGVGSWVAAVILASWSHQGRVRTEAQFAALAGTSPIPASSGNTQRHRFNRGGDRQLNRALHTIARTRMACDQTTQDYVAKRRAQGKNTREIMRSLKRYIARQIFRTLTTITTPTPAQA